MKQPETSAKELLNNYAITVFCGLCILFALSTTQNTHLTGTWEESLLPVAEQNDFPVCIHPASSAKINHLPGNSFRRTENLFCVPFLCFIPVAVSSIAENSAHTTPAGHLTADPANFVRAGPHTAVYFTSLYNILFHGQILFSCCLILLLSAVSDLLKNHPLCFAKNFSILSLFQNNDPDRKLQS